MNTFVITQLDADNPHNVWLCHPQTSIPTYMWHDPAKVFPLQAVVAQKQITFFKANVTDPQGHTYRNVLVAGPATEGGAHV
jgi:hypothetical protein